MDEHNSASPGPVARFYALLTETADILGCICLACMTLVTLVAIVFRYVLNSALPWPEEATRYFFIVATYMGISVVMSRNGHLRMEILTLFCGQNMKKWLNFLSLLVTTGFFIGLCPLAWAMMTKVQTMAQTAIAFPLPLWIIWLLMLISFVFSSLQALRQIYLLFFEPGVFDSENGEVK